MLFVIGILFKRVSIIFYKLSCAFVCACACAHERAQLCLINIFLPLILLGVRARAIEMHEVKSTIATLDSVYKWLWFVIHINLHSLFLSLAFSLSLPLMNVWCLFSKMWTNNYGNNFDLKYKSRLINIEIEIPDEKSLVWPCTSSSSHSEHHYYSLFSIEMRISHLFHTLSALWLAICSSFFRTIVSPALIHLSQFSIWERLFIYFVYNETQHTI